MNNVNPFVLSTLNELDVNLESLLFGASKVYYDPSADDGGC